jgi:hypothetical protein
MFAALRRFLYVFESEVQSLSGGHIEDQKADVAHLEP